MTGKLRPRVMLPRFVSGAVARVAEARGCSGVSGRAPCQVEVSLVPDFDLAMDLDHLTHGPEERLPLVGRQEAVVRVRTQ